MKINMKRIRLELGLTQKELAPRLKIEPSQVSLLETGRYLPSLQRALFFSKVLSELAGKTITVNDLYELERNDLK